MSSVLFRLKTEYFNSNIVLSNQISLVFLNSLRSDVEIHHSWHTFRRPQLQEVEPSHNILLEGNYRQFHRRNNTENTTMVIRAFRNSVLSMSTIKPTTFFTVHLDDQSLHMLYKNIYSSPS